MLHRTIAVALPLDVVALRSFRRTNVRRTPSGNRAVQRDGMAAKYAEICKKFAEGHTRPIRVKPEAALVSMQFLL